MDLPGYGYAKVPFAEKDRWSQLMEGYFRTGRDIRLVLQLVDMRHSATAFDVSMLEFLQYHKLPYAIVLTKSDKLNKAETEKRLSAIHDELGPLADGVPIIPFSALKGTGTEDIRDIIESALKSNKN